MFETTKLYADVQKKFRTAHSVRAKYERDWKMDLAFFQGRQWVVYDAPYRRVVDWVPFDAKRKGPRLVLNMILPVVRLEYARLTKNRPTFTVVATTADEDDVAKSRGCKRFLGWLWETCGWADVFRKALAWALTTGNGFVKVFWDSSAGPIVEVDGTAQALGDVAIDHVSPFELFIDPFARSLDEASWVIHARLRSVDYVYEKYGVKVSGDASAVVTIPEGLPSGRNAYGADSALPATLVKEYWERPSTLYPRGRYAVIASNKVLYAGDNPYAATCPIPFAHMGHLPVPGELYSSSIIKHLRQVNVVYNKLFSDIVANTSKLATPPLLAPLNSLLTDPRFEPGEILYYNPLTGGDNIRPLDVNPYPPHVVNLLLRILQQRDDISGVSEVSRGTVPRNVRSAAALSYLLETDETRLGVTARAWEAFIGRALQYALNLARQFYTTPRVLRILGDNSVWEAKLFKAEDIPPDADVRVEPGSTLPKSVTYQQEFVMNLWRERVITDPRLVLRLTQYGSMEEVQVDLDLDSGQASRENQKLLAGEQVEVEDFHNHTVHIVEHNRFRKTTQYEELPPERKEVFKAHVAQHMAYLSALGAMSAQAQQQGRQTRR